MAPWTTYEKWSQAKKDKYNKNAERINKAWGEKNEIERRERVAKELELDESKKLELVDESKEVQSKINSTVSTNEDQSPTSKNRCSLS